MKGLWHVSFTVANLDASVSFYVDYLGFQVVHRQVQDNDYTRRLVGYPDAVLEVAMLRMPDFPTGASGHHLELVEYRSPRREPRSNEPAQPGTAHLALEVMDVMAIWSALPADLRMREPVRIEAGRNEGGMTVYFKDPDGNLLELVQPRRPE